MIKVNWIAPDPDAAYANYICANCQLRINKGEPIYMAKQHTRTVKLCEECAEVVEMEREVTDDMRESWLSEDY